MTCDVSAGKRARCGGKTPEEKGGNVCRLIHPGRTRLVKSKPSIHGDQTAFGRCELIAFEKGISLGNVDWPNPRWAEEMARSDEMKANRVDCNVMDC
jgi:hypothetical protein